MSSVLWNPTDRLEEEFAESFIGQHLGVEVRVDPGQKLKVSDKTAKHILNIFAPRGLISLDYGDDEEKRAEEALERNRTFKIKQINDYNEKNEARKHMGLPYLWPHKQIKIYAKEFGAKLIESYKIDDAQMAKTQALEKENLDLRAQMSEMNEKMNLLLERMDGEDKEPKEVPEVPLTKNGKPDKRFVAKEKEDPGG